MFHFVPRKVAQKTPRPARPSLPVPPVASTSDSSTRLPSSDANGKGKSAEEPVKNEDLFALLWLSLSDHTLWANVDLRRAVASADEGWIPLSYALQQSAHMSHLPVRPSEASLVRAVRAQADCPLQVRMLVSSPSKAAWYGKESTSTGDAGGYEIRRRDWSEALTRVRNSTRNEWEARTVYMESIPLPSRTVPGIFHFVSTLGPSAGPVPDVQSIILPPHHLDRPGDVPKCKGFALVTFSSTDTVARLVDDWPWLPRRAALPAGAGSSTAHEHEAARFGFRVLPKARWDALKEEYLAYRQQLLDSVAGASAGPSAPQRTNAARNGNTRADADDATMAADEPERAREPSALDGALDPSAPFPPGCLVFVRGVHPETNKTTLKALFAAHAFGANASNTVDSQGAAAALDYVDYSKGMTSCHLRLSAPHHAQALVSALADRPLVQRQGLDCAGSPAEGDEKPVAAEVVGGEREALYWNKVPEKVRREAVRRAVAQLVGQGKREGEEGRGHGADEQQHEGGKRPRKRRRKV